VRLFSRVVSSLIVLLSSICSVQAALPAHVRQLVVVITPDWDATQGSLHAFESANDGWRPLSQEVPVSIGRAGSAWGLGLHDPQQGPQKSEGDGRSPAGMFAIGKAFGYAAEFRSGLSYQSMTKFDYCVDVNESTFYNRIVDARQVGEAAVSKSTEPMRRDIHAKGDQRYKLGFVIEHNPKNIPAKGSCIFTHLWGSPGQTTAGCTAMDEQALRRMVTWLDAKQHPVFVLLPRAEYERLRGRWNLPDVVRAKQ
jgi:L,D-peptidoglycan transpeptidase YkuD (ErfK/YbiS/YcfS/YnhG family)